MVALGAVQLNRAAATEAEKEKMKIPYDAADKDIVPAPMAQDYVVGYAFRPDYCAVALIEKMKPFWQAGKLNGVGGKIEAGESPAAAMTREFEEEAGVKITDWTHFRTEQFMHTTPGKSDQHIGTRVYHFACRVLPEMWQFIRTMEKERIVKTRLPLTAHTPGQKVWIASEHFDTFHQLIYNLPYLIPMAATLLQQPPENRPVP